MATAQGNVDDEGNSSDSQEAEMSPKEIIDRVTTAWQNEKLSSELLTPVEGELEALRDLIGIMEGNMRMLQSTDIRLSIHRMEIKRLRYVMTSYLRIRIMKIQEYPWFYTGRLERNVGAPFLTQNETLFLKEYLGNLESFLLDVAIGNIPVKMRQFADDQLKKPPNLNKFVFFLSHKNSSFTITDANKDRETAEIEDGSQYIMRYQPVRKFLKNEEISLI